MAPPGLVVAPHQLGARAVEVEDFRLDTFDRADEVGETLRIEAAAARSPSPTAAGAVRHWSSPLTKACEQVGRQVVDDVPAHVLERVENVDLPAPDMPVTSSRRGRRPPPLAASELEAHAVERERDLRGRRCRHGVDRDERQLDAQDRTLAAVVGQALDVARQLDDQRDRNVVDAFHLDDPDPPDLELAGNGRRSASRPGGRRRV